MPRDVNGNYTVPPGINPVIPGTPIEDTWANPTLADVAAALTDSLSRSGLGGMTAPFKNADGSAVNPGMTFTNEPTSGIYRASLGVVWFTILGIPIFKISSAGIELAAGLVATNIVNVRQQDADPAPQPQGIKWYDSDSGAMYLRYINPDLTYSWILTNGYVPGDYMPRTGLNTLGNYANDAAAAAGGIPIGEPYRNGSVLMTRIT